MLRCSGLTKTAHLLAHACKGRSLPIALDFGEANALLEGTAGPKLTTIAVCVEDIDLLGVAATVEG